MSSAVATTRSTSGAPPSAAPKTEGTDAASSSTDSAESGKTVLLGKMREEVEDRGWVAAALEAAGDHQDFRQQLGDRLYPALHALAKPGIGQRLRQALSTFANFNVQVDAQGTWTFGLDLEPSAPPSGNLELDLMTLAQDLSAAMKERGAGVAIFIDEMQDLDKDTLTALCASRPPNLPAQPAVLRLRAGPPSLPRVLSEAKSYSERLFEYRSTSDLAPTPPLAPSSTQRPKNTSPGLRTPRASSSTHPTATRSSSKNWAKPPGKPPTAPTGSNSPTRA